MLKNAVDPDKARMIRERDGPSQKDSRAR